MRPICVDAKAEKTEWDQHAHLKNACTPKTHPSRQEFCLVAFQEPFRRESIELYRVAGSFDGSTNPYFHKICKVLRVVEDFLLLLGCSVERFKLREREAHRRATEAGRPSVGLESCISKQESKKGLTRCTNSNLQNILGSRVWLSGFCLDEASVF